jgi:peptide/nickel transport system permease protein
MSMRTIVVKKVANAAITILLILVANFVLFRLLPGDPAITFIRTGAGHSANPELLDRQREIFGLNDPLSVQVGKYLVNTFTGNWGYSFFQGDSLVTEIIAQKAVPTLILVGTSTLLTIWLGMIIGSIAAWRRGKVFDVTSLGLGFFFYAMPTFWFGIMMIVVFQEQTGLIPLLPADHALRIPYPTDLGDILVDGIKHLILPALTLTIGSLAGIAIIMRNSLIDVLTEDYVVTARAKGLSDRMVLKRHAMPNARLPMVTVIALNIGFLLGGAFQVEIIFSYDGLGETTVRAVLNQDYPLLQALFLLITVSVVVANLVSDFVYAWLDPRVRLE